MDNHCCITGLFSSLMSLNIKGHITLAMSIGTIILVAYLQIKSLQMGLILNNRRFRMQFSDPAWVAAVWRHNREQNSSPSVFTGQHALLFSDQSMYCQIICATATKVVLLWKCHGVMTTHRILHSLDNAPYQISTYVLKWMAVFIFSQNVLISSVIYGLNGFTRPHVTTKSETSWFVYFDCVFSCDMKMQFSTIMANTFLLANIFHL